MIRQAISCDVCGAEKKQTNHWFVAWEQAGELRLAGWSSRMKQRPGTKHLCGQTCLHKLVDEFMARTIDGRLSAASASPRPETDASLTSPAAFHSPVSAQRAGAKPLAAVEPLPARPAVEPAIVPVVPFPPPPILQPAPHASLPPQAAEAPQYASRRWRAEAWERERNRDLHSIERPTRHQRF